MPERISSNQRIRLRNRAEVEIQRFAGDHALWHKHVHGVELDPMQVLKMVGMDESPYTMDYSCRRTGKTAVKELHNLAWNAVNGDQEVGIVAPREAQSIVALGYHLEAIRRSEILTAYLAYKSGRKQLSDTRYEFANRSKAQAYGIMAQVDGGDLTVASLEEVDDMPADRLYSRFLLMLASSRRMGAPKDAINDPKIRITGVFKGADTLADMAERGTYRVLPTVDAYLGIEMGILQESFVAEMRDALPAEEYIRQMLCRNVTNKNFIWQTYIQHALTVGLKARLEKAGPVPGLKYRKRGLIGFGYDAGGHGEDPQSSRHALVVTEQMGSYITFPYLRTWPAAADDQVVKRDLIGAWEYFMPDYAIGDAYGVGMLTQLNDELYSRGLTSVDRRTIGDGDSSASTWPHWPFAPMRFEGMTKHSMASALRQAFHGKQAAIPYVNTMHIEPGEEDFALFVRQLANIVSLPTSKAYASYKMLSKKWGDDLFDAGMASVWSLLTRGLADVPTVVIGRRQTRDQLLNAPAQRLAQIA